MTTNLRRSLSPAVGPVLALLLAVFLADGAAAATFNVTSLADSGPGSLRQAVLDANAAAGADTVLFAVAGTIMLTSGEIAITDDLAVQGPGSGALTVSGNDQSRIFRVDNGVAGTIDVLLSGLTLTHGHAHGPGGAVVTAENLTVLGSVISDSVSEGLSALDPARGGNLAQSGGSLRIENSRLSGGVAADGPGDDRGGNVSGNPVVEHSVISGGSADFGGGIDGCGRIHASTISGNSARVNGGGLHCFTGTIDSSTISGNTAQVYGGGILLPYASSGRVLNSTISGNRADFRGGGIFIEGGGSGAIDGFLLMTLSTLVNNTAGESSGNLRIDGDFGALIDHSIMANGEPDEIGDSFISADYTLVENVAHPLLVAGNHNILGVDPLLGPLANNGGPTQTHALLPGSPAIDAGDPAIQNPPPTDQRGFARIFGPAVDLGAVEAQPLGVVDVPTVSQTGTLLLAMLLLATGVWRLRLARRAGAP